MFSCAPTHFSLSSSVQIAKSMRKNRNNFIRNNAGKAESLFGKPNEMNVTSLALTLWPWMFSPGCHLALDGARRVGRKFRLNGARPAGPGETGSQTPIPGQTARPCAAAAHGDVLLRAPCRSSKGALCPALLRRSRQQDTAPSQMQTKLRERVWKGRSQGKRLRMKHSKLLALRGAAPQVLFASPGKVAGNRSHVCWLSPWPGLAGGRPCENTSPLLQAAAGRRFAL